MSYPKDLDEYRSSDLRNELSQRLNARNGGRCDYCGRAVDSTPVCRFPTRHAGKET